MLPRHQADDGAWDGYTRHSYHYDPEGQAKGWHTGVMEPFGIGRPIRYKRKELGSFI